MKYAPLIANAWNLTVQNPKLKWFYFFPSFMAVLIVILEISWQIYLYLGEFEVISQTLDLENVSNFFTFLVQNNLLAWAIFGALFILLFAFVVPSWVLGILILAIKHKIVAPDKYLSIRQKTIAGYDYFFRLFELHAVTSMVSLWTIVLFTATMYRFFHGPFFDILWPIIVGYSFFALIVSTLISFAPFYIVCENMEVSAAIKKSVALVFTHLGVTLAMMCLMFLVSFRVIVNVLVILAVPFGVMAIGTYFTGSVALVISIILGLVLIAFTAYLNAILEIFSTSVWTHTFFILKARQDKLEEVNEGEKVNSEQ